MTKNSILLAYSTYTRRMIPAVRIILTFFTGIAIYFFVYWLPFSLLPAAYKIPYLPNIISLLIAIFAGVFVWKRTGKVSNGLASSILLGGIIVGATGFISGFFGPLIFTPEKNLGPLLGIFITGPIGFIVGLIARGLYWKIKLSTK